MSPWIAGKLADLIVVVHGLYVATVVFGLVFIFAGALMRWSAVRNFWFRTIHLAMIALVVVEALFGIPCPLTVWEYQLREAAGQPVEGRSFVGRLVHELIFYDWPPIVFTILYVVFGLIVLATMVLVPPRWPARRRAA